MGGEEFRRKFGILGKINSEGELEFFGEKRNSEWENWNFEKKIEIEKIGIGGGGGESRGGKLEFWEKGKKRHSEGRNWNFGGKKKLIQREEKIIWGKKKNPEGENWNFEKKKGGGEFGWEKGEFEGVVR